MKREIKPEGVGSGGETLIKAKLGANFLTGRAARRALAKMARQERAAMLKKSRGQQ